MGYEILIALVLTLGFFLLSWEILNRKRCRVSEMPPGPRRWPVVGNIFQLLSKSPAHHTFTELAGEHGPIMTIWLGLICTVIISSADAAREMFKNHDAVLAGRKLCHAMEGYLGNDGSVITAQYGPRWRMLKRLCTTGFLANTKLDATSGVRARCIDQMVTYIEVAGASGTRAIDVGRFFFLMAFNLIGNLMFSKDLLDPDSETGTRFFNHARKLTELLGQPNVADYFPMLKWFDPQGLRKSAQFHIKGAFDIAGLYSKERTDISSSLQDFGEGRKTRDYLDVLLGYQRDNVNEGPLAFSSNTINLNVLEMFVAGTDTTTSTLEWAMTELLRNPEILNKVQAELRREIHSGKKLEEKDLNNFPYLNATVKETLRLHPPVPFLIPHVALDSCNMLDYHIPKDTQVLVNIWAIGRDPNRWENPLEFYPDRFLEPRNCMVDFSGQYFELIPFGSGRRICPGVSLASRAVPLALGSVLHLFDWVLPKGIKPEGMDMREKLGITIRKAVSLKAIPIPQKVLPH